jgi:hypothetical protein
MARNDTFALAIASGATVVEAATRAGISTRTAWRYLQSEHVQFAIARARDEVFTRTVNGLADAALAGVATLREALDHGPPSVRVRAAEVLLAFSMRYRDHADTEQRISDLERRLSDDF